MSEIEKQIQTMSETLDFINILRNMKGEFIWYYKKDYFMKNLDGFIMKTKDIEDGPWAPEQVSLQRFEDFKCNSKQNPKKAEYVKRMLNVWKNGVTELNHKLKKESDSIIAEWEGSK